MFSNSFDLPAKAKEASTTAARLEVPNGSLISILHVWLDQNIFCSMVFCVVLLFCMFYVCACGFLVIIPVDSFQSRLGWLDLEMHGSSFCWI